MPLLYILVLVVIVNSIYFLLFSKFSFLKIDTNSPDSDVYPVSVIISAKNESANLKKNIPQWLKQDHPNFELIIINDASVDNTLEVINSFANEDNRIKVVDIENNETFWGSKKYALTLGIKRSTNQRMLFTDADCSPATNQWIREMSRHFSTEKQIILGYGAYQKRSGFLNSMIRFETLMTAIQYFSYAKVGMAYMGVGRNLGYTSSLYYNNSGFMSHMKIASGDDDLFVNETATTQNTALCLSPTAFTYSTPAKSYKKWILQKRRHITTSKYYKIKTSTPFRELLYIFSCFLAHFNRMLFIIGLEDSIGNRPF